MNESMETFSLTDSSLGMNGGVEDSLSWGVAIQPQPHPHPHPRQQQQQQQHMNVTSNPNPNPNPNPSSYRNVMFPTLPPQSSSSNTNAILTRESAFDNLTTLPQQLSRLVNEDLHSPKPSHLSTHQLIPILPLAELVPGNSHGSFRERGDTRTILNIWLGLELDSSSRETFKSPFDHSKFSLDEPQSSHGGARVRSLPKTVETEAQVRQQRLTKALENGDRIRSREQKETKRDEQRLRRLTKAGERQRKGNKGDKGKSKKQESRVVKMEVDDDEDASKRAASSNRLDSTAPTPWDLALEARRRKARLQVRNSDQDSMPLQESLTILDSVASAEEWSYPLLNSPSGADGARIGTQESDSIWGAAESPRNTSGNVDSNHGEDLRIRSERERNGVQSGSISNPIQAVDALETDVNHRPNPPEQRRNLSNRRLTRTVPELMRESWDQGSRSLSPSTANHPAVR